MLQSSAISTMLHSAGDPVDVVLPCPHGLHSARVVGGGGSRSARTQLRALSVVDFMTRVFKAIVLFSVHGQHIHAKLASQRC